mmetsp:Transcript_26542/g.61920  ORF Transcript_26542/g.61920 Transcript_26542/m.61920 type:complete len:324 (+) Transcript_26542:761-1732(+)
MWGLLKLHNAPPTGFHESATAVRTWAVLRKGYGRHLLLRNTIRSIPIAQPFIGNVHGLWHTFVRPVALLSATRCVDPACRKPLTLPVEHESSARTCRCVLTAAHCNVLQSFTFDLLAQGCSHKPHVEAIAVRPTTAELGREDAKVTQQHQSAIGVVAARQRARLEAGTRPARGKLLATTQARLCCELDQRRGGTAVVLRLFARFSIAKERSHLQGVDAARGKEHEDAGDPPQRHQQHCGGAEEAPRHEARPQGYPSRGAIHFGGGLALLLSGHKGRGFKVLLPQPLKRERRLGRPGQLLGPQGHRRAVLVAHGLHGGPSARCS